MANTFKFGNGNWAVKKDSVLAYNDENNNFKPLPFDFTRNTIGTYVDSDGLIKTAASGEARIDYLDNANGHLLLEPSRTNVLSQSENIASWSTAGSVTTTSNYGTSPEGVQNSTRVQYSGGSEEIKLAATSPTGCTASVYVKGTNGETIKFGSVGSEELFTLNGSWQRIEKYNSGTPTHITINTYSGATARDIEVWGAQLESGSYATSYIPTNGQSVTRAAESNIQFPPSGVIGLSEGTMFFELENKGQDRSASNFRLSLNFGSALDNWIFLGFEDNNTVRFYVRSGAITSVDRSSTAQSVGVIKAAARYKSNGDYVLYVNGSQTNYGSGAVISQSLNRINIGSPATVQDFIREIKLYNTALTDAELETLTQV